MSWKRKDFIAIEDLSVEEIEQVLSVAAAFKRTLGRSHKKLPALRGKTVVNLFLEPSTRTRVAFEMAAKRLSADVISLDMASSSTTKGETLRDTAQNIQALNADILIIRHAAAGSAAYLSHLLHIPVINAGDGAHEHPTQALLDALTIRRRKGRIAGLTVAICGDILHSRVARSNILLLRTMGARVRVVAPPTLLPAAVESLGVEAVTDMRRGLEDADIVMMLRLQSERMQGSLVPSVREYFHFFGLTHEKLRAAKPDAMIMHPGPMNRGVEIDGPVADDINRSAILDQVEMGVAVRMAVLDALTRRLRANR